MPNKNKYFNGMVLIKQEIIELQATYLESLFKIIIQYYNYIQNTRPILLEKNQTDWKYTNVDNLIQLAYDTFSASIKTTLESMMEDVYSIVSTRIRELYGDLDYPISSIEFFNKDGLTIDDRINKWWNPYNDKKISSTFIKNKNFAEAKIAQINKAEALNLTEKIKYDKLFHQSDYIEIANEDEEDDCLDNISCETYWGRYSVKDDDLPRLPIYHPDCECFVVYYNK